MFAMARTRFWPEPAASARATARQTHNPTDRNHRARDRQPMPDGWRRQMERVRVAHEQERPADRSAIDLPACVRKCANRPEFASLSARTDKHRASGAYL